MTAPHERIVRAVTCLGCGCACDDIDVVARGGTLSEARGACEAGVIWFGDGLVPERTRIGQRDVPIDAAIAEAANLLCRASRPLVYLAPDISCEVQREGVAIADVLRAAIDSVTSTGAMAPLLAAQERGRVSATLGQVRSFADVVVFWGVDPAQRYPRFWSRYGVDPPGLQVPDGRRSRTIVAVDVGPSRGPGDADLRIALEPGDEVAAITGTTTRVASAAATVTAQDNQPGAVRALADALLAGRYVTIVADGESDPLLPDRDPGRSSALIALTQALNTPTRAALSLLRAGGNRSGADAVLTWQTGYPMSVDFARGYPEYRPYDGSAIARLSRGDVDAVLVLGAAARMPDAVGSAMANIPCVVIGPHASASRLAERGVAIDTGVAGIHEGGTALRMDDVPLPLRAPLESPNTAAGVARALRDGVVKNRRAITR